MTRVGGSTRVEVIVKTARRQREEARQQRQLARDMGVRAGETLQRSMARAAALRSRSEQAGA